MKHAQGWAEKAINALPMAVGSYSVNARDVAKLLKAEHARAIRLVKAEMKRVKMDQHTYRSEERCLVLGSLETVLTALQRGRGGKG